MHRPGVGFGKALWELRRRDRFSEEALDRRVAAAVNATSLSALLYRLRGLTTQLRADAIAFDYDLLVTDLAKWPYPEPRQRVRRTWGLAYYAPKAPRSPRPQGADRSRRHGARHRLRPAGPRPR
ncbi:type I-E CRISPR-associated protein Cse2/CasB [Streptomyces sp. M19]